MPKKILLNIAPILVLTVLAVAPAMASAASRAYGTCAAGAPENDPPCGAGAHFTAFPTGTSGAVLSEKAVGSGAFILENTEKAGIKCETLTGKGTVENVVKGGEVVGTGKEKLTFGDCVPIKELGAGCTEINPKTNHEITGEVSDEVAANGETVGIEILKTTPHQFDVKCVIEGIEVDLKGVKGTTTGTINGSKLEFNKAKGLTFFGSSSTITGSDETATEGTKKPVSVGGTRPSVSTGGASSVEQRWAELNGTVDPEGSGTKYYFEYGKTMSYGSKTTEVNAGSGTSGVGVSQVITGLERGTTYHFRIVATNSWGTTDGADETLTTAWAGAGRAYGTCATGSGESSSACERGEAFTAFPTGTPVGVVSVKAAGSGAFIFEGEAHEAIECTGFASDGTFNNVVKGEEVVGTGTGEVTFQDCVPLKELGAGCREINPKTHHEITGEVTDEVASLTQVKIKIDTGTQFDVECVIGGEEINFGGFSGTAGGSIDGNKLVFNKAEGLKQGFFFGVTNITGTYRTETATGKPVYVS